MITFSRIRLADLLEEPCRNFLPLQACVVQSSPVRGAFVSTASPIKAPTAFAKTVCCKHKAVNSTVRAELNSNLAHKCA